MRAVKPFGDVKTATILVIGHDPCLQRSRAAAKVAFFFDYFARPCPTSRSEASKYDLAQAVWNYVNELVGRGVLLAELYVTNLCNKLPEHKSGSGTVLIPDALASRGVERIAEAVAAASLTRTHGWWRVSWLQHALVIFQEMSDTRSVS